MLTLENNFDLGTCRDIHLLDVKYSSQHLFKFNILLYFIILESKQKEERFGTSNSWTLQKNYKFGKKET